MRKLGFCLMVIFIAMSIAVQSQTLPAYLPTNGLVGWWPFNGNANDESGNGNHGTVNGATLTADRNGNANSAFSFNGLNNFIDIQSTNGLISTQGLSMSMWFKWNGPNGIDNHQYVYLIAPNPNGGVVISDNSVLSANVLNCNCADDVGVTTTIELSVWYFVALTYDLSSGLLKMYLNGNEVASSQETMYNYYTTNNNADRFGNYHFNSHYYRGEIDDAALYNRALTPSEITALYNGTTDVSGCTNATACNYNASATLDDGTCTFPAQTYLNCDGTCINDTDADGICNELETPSLPTYLPTNGLVGYWPFNGNANDESGNGNHGTVNGATLTADRNGNASSAYSFNGASNYITAGNYAISGSFTISAWYQLYSYTLPDNDIFFVSNQYLNESVYNANVAVGFRSYYGEFGHSTYVSSPLTGYYAINNLPVANIWHHIVYVFENGVSVKMYQDNSLVYSNYTVLSNANFPSKPINFGSTGTVNPYYLNGLLDDIAIYNRALTQEEITALYTGTSSNNNGGSGTSGTPAASVPAGIPYQAVIRDNAGAALVNTPVSVRFTLHQNTTDGTVEYQETQSLTTNSLGLINTQFGSGTATQGTFASINWSNTTKFIQVEANTGAGYVDMGTQQMMSVPFAIKSNESNKIKNAGLPVYADNAAALAGGLTPGEMYRTANGDLKVVF